jgi:GDP-4-dehydro-6-deoxy-D-mannose reductase
VRVLITGVSGFVGPYVADHIAEVAPETELYGLLWGELDQDRRRQLGSDLRLLEGDVTDPAAIAMVLETSRPDVIVHMAAASSVARSWSNVARALEINAIGTANLFETILELQMRPVIVVSSSAEVYGRVDPEQGPIGEHSPLAPVSPYGTSKAAQDLLAAQYVAGRGLAVVRLRPFHLTGPRRPDHFVVSSFAAQIARIEHGLEEPLLKVGNLDAVRDITDVRDAARAYWLAGTRGTGGEVYNLCSGRSLRVGDLLDELLALSNAHIAVEVDAGRLRTHDIPWLVGDHSRLTATTGWQPVIPLRQTLLDLLEWWRGEVSANDPHT